MIRNTMIRNANLNDIPEILEIYSYARNFMCENGNPSQWAGNFPSVSIIENDVYKRQLFVLEESGEIHGVFAFIIGEDETYLNIEQGAWISCEEYGTIHRVATDGKIHGFMQQVVLFCENKISHLRIDTHEDNRIMRHLIIKNGFRQCGIIHVRDGSPRIAYEKV